MFNRFSISKFTDGRLTSANCGVVEVSVLHACDKCIDAAKEYIDCVYTVSARKHMSDEVTEVEMVMANGRRKVVTESEVKQCGTLI
jgi:hypothetical protein